MVYYYPAEENNEVNSILCTTWFSGERSLAGIPVVLSSFFIAADISGWCGVYPLYCSCFCSNISLFFYCLHGHPSKFLQRGRMSFVKQEQLFYRGMEFCRPVKVTFLKYHSLSWISKIDTSNTTVHVLLNTEVYFNRKGSGNQNIMISTYSHRDIQNNFLNFLQWFICCKKMASFDWEWLLN